MATPQEIADPSTRSMAFNAMEPGWNRTMAVLGGTEAMREAGELYLPRHRRETRESWQTRLNTNVLLNITELTLNNWVGRPFGTPVGFGDDVPPQIAALADDIDLMGTDIGTFLREAFRIAIAFGIVHIRVDMPQFDMARGIRTRADDLRDGVRPYWSIIPPYQVIFAHSDRSTGYEILNHMRIMTETINQVGFAEELTSHIQVWEPNLVSVYREDPTVSQGRQNRWVLESERPYGFERIPIKTFYTHRTDYMISKSPLTDLVNLNISHWQLISDLRRGVTATMFPMLFGSGIQDDPNNTEIEIGPFKMFMSPDPQAALRYVEHSGSALGTAREYIQDLENLMGLYGAEFLRARPGTITVNKTATQSALEAAAVVSPLEDIALRFKDFFERVLDLTAEIWGIGDTPGIGGTIDLLTDFSDTDNQQGLEILERARARRDISSEAFIEELKRREILPMEFDLEVDRAILDAEPIIGGFTEHDIELIEAEQRRASIRNAIDSES